MITLPFDQVFANAWTAAEDAIIDERAARPENPHEFDCGFAWVVVKPGTHPFIGWCRKQIKLGGGERNRDTIKYGHKHYYGGWEFWEPGGFNGQSIRIHLVGARAFADYLKTQGIDAYVGSRLD